MQQDFTEDVLAKIGAFTELLAHIDETIEKIVGEVSQVDLEQQDILHEIERIKFNACEGYILVKKLQDVRKRRRIVKNQWEVLRAFRDGFASNNKTLHVALYKTLTRMRQIREQQTSRTYFPRTTNKPLYLQTND